VAAIAAKVHASLSQPFALARREVRVTASIGVAVYPHDGAGLEELLAHADSAMYHAKRQGRGRTEYYRAELSEAVQRRLLIEESMRDACSGEGLILHFQPQVSLQHPDSPVGAEALLRWRHPTLGMLTPDAFIQLAEETGMIVPMGRWVLESAARAAVRWNTELPQPLCISVNVSTRQFMLDNLPDVVDEVLGRTGCDPRWLSIEITESALLEDSKPVQQALEAFRVRGMQVAIDDFGTGYSALNYLGRFHVDCMKIDKSFVQAIGRSNRDGELVKAFVAMASALNLSTVAEGIETDEQAAFLLANGCGHAQGYRFGRPMPEAQFEREVLRAALQQAVRPAGS
jgi:EAL domain-containing protein (putative c-di-GMP-specific phosphodiesterase class I)